ncbi:MAG: DNA alkylation repair protein, partial [Bacteroidota bacterium]
MAELLVNQYFQRPFLDEMGELISKEYSAWDQSLFLGRVYAEDWDQKALLQRMAHISQVLKQGLPEEYLVALDILKRAAKGNSGFNGMVLSDFVGQFGIDQPKESLDALEIFTQVGSAEFAIRQFILKHEVLTMRRMEAWARHPNEHVRRLASEGCRPRLPWAVALPKYKKDPSPVLPILDQLKEDPSMYVRKSVANHLNDLSKDNPEVLLDLLESWKPNAPATTQWIIKHALRSLVKQGSPRALSLLGFESKNIKVSHLQLKPHNMSMGETLEFGFEITNLGEKEAQVVVDYQIHFVKANGVTAPKVFKLKNVKLGPEQSIQMSKSHTIKPITTRKYYSGHH